MCTHALIILLDLLNLLALTVVIDLAENAIIMIVSLLTASNKQVLQVDSQVLQVDCWWQSSVLTLAIDGKMAVTISDPKI